MPEGKNKKNGRRRVKTARESCNERSGKVHAYDA